MVDSKMPPKPLEGMDIVEVARPGPTGITGIAVAFAGHLLAGLGGRVTRVVADGDDPLSAWPPLLPDGSSALHRFLTHAKAAASSIPATRAALICDDRNLAAAWRGGPTVLVEPTQGGMAITHSELTVLAASGLLDIVGQPTEPPLPLPGHQTAYAAGIVAFNALLCAQFAKAAGRPVLHQRVCVLDVALWLNWKHYLAAYLQLDDAGVGRAEEWRTYRCRDGYIAFVFQDKDLSAIARLTSDVRFNDARFSTPSLRRRNLDAFSAMVDEWARDLTRDEIVTMARSQGLPVGPVLAIDELLDDRQMLARNFIDLVRGSPTFGLPQFPATWIHTQFDRAREGTGDAVPHMGLEQAT